MNFSSRRSAVYVRLWIGLSYDMNTLNRTGKRHCFIPAANSPICMMYLWY